MNPYRNKEEPSFIFVLPKDYEIILTHNDKDLVLRTVQKLNGEGIKGLFIEDEKGFSIAIPAYFSTRAKFLIDGTRTKGRLTSPKRYL